jgi:hypothetical protein
MGISMWQHILQVVFHSHRGHILWHGLHYSYRTYTQFIASYYIYMYVWSIYWLSEYCIHILHTYIYTYIRIYIQIYKYYRRWLRATSRRSLWFCRWKTTLPAHFSADSWGLG